MIKVLILDFDGTLVTKDQLSEVIELVGKKEESERLDRLQQEGVLKGRESLIRRINLLQGVHIGDIEKKVRSDLALTSGAKELIAYAKSVSMQVIVATGSIECILKPYDELFHFDQIIASKPKVEQGVIVGISESDYPTAHFKVDGIEKFLEHKHLRWRDCMAVGDSRGDIPMFEKVGKERCIAINPKGGVEEYTRWVVKDLNEAVRVIEHYSD